MNKWTALFLLGICCLQCESRKPFMPRLGSLPFIVYFNSRYRGLCVGTLISRTAVITAAVCVTNPLGIDDTRPINVVTGAMYRHPRRGIRVQVTKVLLPHQLNSTENKGYLVEQSAAVLILKQKIPDILTEVPQRAIDIDWRGEEVLSLQEECMMAGWHFFWKGDKIYPVMKFLLHRNLRVQFLNIVKKNLWCETLAIKFQKAMSNMGFYGLIDTSSGICVRDPDRMAQPCHGMYGAPLICRGRAVAMLMAPDAQWSNCTGHSNLLHLFSGGFLRGFMTCIQGLMDPDFKMDWASMKKSIYDDYSANDFDYIPEIYDKVYGDSGSSSGEL